MELQIYVIYLSPTTEDISILNIYYEAFFFLYPFPTILSKHKCILFCVQIITHNRILSMRTPYIQFFTKYYNALNVRAYRYCIYIALKIY